MAREAEIERMVVRLMGDGEDYRKMMREAVRETDRFEKKINEAEKSNRKFVRSLKTIGADLQKFGRTMRRVGTTLSFALTAPLVGIGTLAIREFGQFGTALSRMQGLVGLSEDVVAGFAEEIKGLAGVTARGPVELAEAMFFITSGSLRGASAVEALEASAKAATAGLGTTASVADAVTSAMNAYGAANLSGMRATEVLTAAVREGKAEASSFAPVLGQVLPTANELGVSFDQAAGVIAFLTRATGSASIATTGFRGVLTQLIRPTAEAQKILDQMGVSNEDLRASIRERGLLATLVDLRNMFESQGVPITKMFQDIEGLNALLQLTGPQVEAAAQVIENVGNSAGIVDEAFGAASKTVGFQWNQALAEAKVALLDIGDTLAPTVRQIISGIRSAVNWWNELSAATRGTLIQTGVFVAAVGPVLTVIGGMTIAIGGAITAYTNIIGWMKKYQTVSMAVRAATVATSLAIKGLAVIAGTRLAMGIAGAGQAMRQLNFELAESLRLTNELIGVENDRVNEIVRQAGQIKDPEARSEFLEGEIEQAEQALKQARSMAKTAREDMRDFQEEISSGLRGALQTFFDVLPGVEFATGETEVLEGAIAEADTKVRAAQSRIDALRQALGQAGVEVDSRVGEGSLEAAQKLKELQDSVDSLSDSFQHQIDTFKMTGRQAQIYALQVKGADDSLLGLLRTQDEQLTRMEEQREAFGEQSRLSERIDTLNQRLREQAAIIQHDLAGPEIDIFKLKLEGVSNAQLKESIALATQLKQLKGQQDLFKEGERVTERFLSPAERLQKLQTELDTLFNAGAISAETYRRALMDAQHQTESFVRLDATLAGSAEALSRTLETLAIAAQPRTPGPGEAPTGVPAGVPVPVGVPAGPVPATDNPTLTRIATAIERLVEIGEEELNRETIELSPLGL